MFGKDAGREGGGEGGGYLGVWKRCGERGRGRGEST